MKLTEEEYHKVTEALSKLQEMFDDQIERHVIPRVKGVDSQLVKLMRDKYLTVTGLGDLLEDYSLLEKKEKECDNGCAAPCEFTCVAPCANACNNSPKERT